MQIFSYPNRANAGHGQYCVSFQEAWPNSCRSMAVCLLLQGLAWRWNSNGRRRLFLYPYECYWDSARPWQFATVWVLFSAGLGRDYPNKTPDNYTTYVVFEARADTQKKKSSREGREVKASFGSRPHAHQTVIPKPD